MDYRGYRMLVPILHSLRVKLAAKNFKEVKTLLQAQVSVNSATGEETLAIVWSTNSDGSIILWMALLQWSMVCVCSEGEEQ